MDFHTCSLFITLTVFLVYKVVVHGKNLVVIQQKQVFFLLVTHKQHQTQGIESGIFIFIWATFGERWQSRYNKIMISSHHEPNEMG